MLPFCESFQTFLLRFRDCILFRRSFSFDVMIVIGIIVSLLLVFYQLYFLCLHLFHYTYMFLFHDWNEPRSPQFFHEWRLHKSLVLPQRSFTSAGIRTSTCTTTYSRNMSHTEYMLGLLNLDYTYKYYLLTCASFIQEMNTNVYLNQLSRKTPTEPNKRNRECFQRKEKNISLENLRFLLPGNETQARDKIWKWL